MLRFLKRQSDRTLGEGWPLLYDRHRYAADWLGQGAGYTLQHSLAPEKPLYDTEWHSIGTLQWRDEHMSAEYVELAVWFSLYHHLALNVAWYMPREGLQPQPPSKFPGSLVGSFATLPAATGADNPRGPGDPRDPWDPLQTH